MTPLKKDTHTVEISAYKMAMIHAYNLPALQGSRGRTSKSVRSAKPLSSSTVLNVFQAHLSEEINSFIDFQIRKSINSSCWFKKRSLERTLLEVLPHDPY
jgi:hypothetical protein